MIMKRLEPDEVLSYIPLETGDPLFARKAIAFTLTPCKDPGFSGWEDVTYYTNDSISNSPLSPLEIMYKEWDDINPTGDLGD